jgi:ADP-heptose:LPS heptosyltransferase
VTEKTLQHILECGLLPEADAGLLTQMSLALSAPQRCGSASVLIHPGSGSRRKRWALSGFLELAAQIKAHRMNPAFVIGPAESDLLPELELCGATIHRPADGLDLLALLRSAAAYVGNDSGVSHLAAWVGLACVVIFGPSDPVHWRPIGRSVEIVQPSLDCRPCFETMSANCAEEGCLARITVQEVTAAFHRAAATRPNPG